MKRNRDFLRYLSSITHRPCTYFPEITAPVEEAFLWNVNLSPRQTDEFLARGWRHVSSYFYRNSCGNCRRCLPIRVPVGMFEPSKSQRRVLRKNAETEFKMFEPAEFAAKYIKKSLLLYNRFLRVRYHRPPCDLDGYLSEFFVSPTRLLVSALFIDGRLAGNGFLDLGEESLSTIYFSFEPRFSSFSPGNYSIMKEIEWASERALKYYYLGYCINEISAMRYKGLFRPAELLDFDTGEWKDIDAGDDGFENR
jgi:arginyl-tRNA--protein-N-Asp/Glu arginylyltransferase